MNASRLRATLGDLRLLAGCPLVSVLLFLSFGAAQAHKPSDAYLRLEIGASEIKGRWDIALRDLDAALDLDANSDGKLTWGEVRTREREIDDYALSRLAISELGSGQGQAQHQCVLRVQGHALERHSDGIYLVLNFNSPCSLQRGFSIEYRLFEEIDPTHRGVTRVSFAEQPPIALVLDPARRAMIVTPAGVAGATTAASAAAAKSNAGRDTSAGAANPAPSIAHAGFLREGIHHILVGYDHVLFLLCLLLPSVLVQNQKPLDRPTENPKPMRCERYWQPAGSIGAALWPLAGTVTAFTIAHSITLGLASARIVHLSQRFIEPAIAVTIMLAALNNLQPVVTRRIAIITFAFGLIHGFGFAEVLRDLDLPRGDFAWALLQFNLGVEIGQLIIVSAVIAPLFWLRKTRFYQTAILRTGSVFGFAIAAIWFAERVFDFKVLPV